VRRIQFLRTGTVILGIAPLQLLDKALGIDIMTTIKNFRRFKVPKKKYLSILMTLLLIFSFSACKKKEASVEDILKESLTEHIRITNDVFYERGKETGKGTSIRIAGPVRVVVDRDGKRAITDTAIELSYISENKSTKAPMRVTWELKEGKWSAVNVLPEEFGFIIAFDEETLEKMKKK
jgi:hypothetical protein